MIFNTHKFIKDNPDILITRADKGSVPIIVNKENYTCDVKKVLSDVKYYILLENYPLESLKSREKYKITVYKNLGYFDEFNKYSLSVTNSVLAICYWVV